MGAGERWRVKYYKVLFHLILFFPSLGTTMLGKVDEVRGNRKTSELGKGDEKGVLFCLLLVIFRK